MGKECKNLFAPLLQEQVSYQYYAKTLEMIQDGRPEVLYNVVLSWHGTDVCVITKYL